MRYMDAFGHTSVVERVVSQTLSSTMLGREVAERLWTGSNEVGRVLACQDAGKPANWQSLFAYVGLHKWTPRPETM